MLFCVLLLAPLANAADKPNNNKRKTIRVAAVVTVFRHNSHGEMIVGRLLRGYNLDDKSPRPSIQLASLYVDQFPKNDLSRDLAAKHKVPIYKTIEGALTLGTGKLAVDGVIMVAEHGTYEYNSIGQHLYPKRRLFGEIVKVFDKSGRFVPVFTDKHLSHDWKEAEWIYRQSRRLKFPLMAGSSIQTYTRNPPVDVDRGKPLQEIIAVGYGGGESYGFHALEMMQTLAERRKGGETGVASVQCLTGDAVWKAAGKLYDPALLKQAVNVSEQRSKSDKPLRELVRKPAMYSVRYRDGLRASVFMLNGVAREFSAAWRYKSKDGKPGRSQATVFQVLDERPYSHFSTLLKGIEQMMHTGQPTWPVERTLLTTGILSEAMLSKSRNDELRKTPHLKITYTSTWNWKQPKQFVKQK